MKKFYILSFLISALFWHHTAKAQLPYIKPCYSINAGADTTFCSTSCTNITRTAIPQYDNKATTTYLVQQMTLPTPAYNNTGSNVIVDLDDIWSGVVNIGFNFCFFGNTYNKIVIGANGLVSFNTAYSGAYCNWSYTGGIPDANKPINSIMGPYMDIDPSVGFSPSRINYYTEGSYPCRRFVINFRDIPLYSCNSNRLTSQIILHEAYNIIDVIIYRKDVCGSWNGGRSIIGIQNAAGNAAFTAPGNNPSTSSASNQCWRFLPDGALLQSINWTLNGNIVSNSAVLSASICPTSTSNFVANLVNNRCDGSTVTVSDDANFTINQLPTPDAGPDKVIGCLAPTVTIGTPAVPGNTYTWTPAGNVSNPNIAQPTTGTTGNYTVTVRNTATGCQATDAVTVTQNNTPPVANAGADQVLSCSGVTLGTPAVAGNSYSWSPPGGLSDPTVAQPTTTTANTYTLTVTNIANGCSATDAVTVTGSIIIPTANAGPDKTITCAAPSTQIGTPAVAGNTYAWSPPAGLDNPNIAQPTASAPGTYTLTVTNSTSGCTATDAVTITQNNTPPLADAGADATLTCSTISLPIGSPAIAGNTYAWSPPAGLSSTSIAAPTASAPGTYTVTVTNTANGCIATDAVTISQNIIPPTANAGADKTLTCTNPSLQIGTGAIVGNTYAWTPPAGLDNATIAQPTVSVPGTYTITVTNTANGCSATDAVIVSQNITPPLANAGGNKTLTCANPSLPIGTAAIAGNTYAWSPAIGLTGPNTAQPTANAPGTYTLTVTNSANGCTSTDVVDVLQNIAAPTANAGVDKTLTCANPSLAIGTAAIAGNTYAWSPASGLTGPNTAQPTANAPGTYTLTVTNTGNGCTSTDVVVVAQDITPPIANAGANVTLTCTNTSITIGTTAIAGNTYTWSPPAGLSTTGIAQPDATAPGTYTVTVTNTNNGCVATDAVIVAQNITPPVADAGVDKTLTCASPSLQIGTAAIAGNTYTWSPPAGLSNGNTAAPTTNTPGTYTLTVTNTANGCTATDAVTISQNITPPVANAGVDKTLTCTNPALQIGTAGSVNNTYSWSPTAGLSDDSIAQPTASSAATYTLTVRNTLNGCTATDAVTISQNTTPPVANAGADKTLTCSVTSLQIGTPAVAGNMYFWLPDSGLSSAGVAQPNTTVPATYTLTVTNLSNGCTATDVVIISQDTTPPITNAGADKTLTCTNTSLQIGTAVVAGNTYLWSPATGLDFASIAQPTTSTPDTYTLTVTNTSNGCKATDEVIVSQDTTPPVANAGVDKLLTCTNPTLPIGTTAVSGNSYSWSPATGLIGPTTAQPSVNTPGTYTLTVTNTANGCISTDVVNITQDIIPPVANAGADKTLTCSNPTLQIGTAAASGNTYAWVPASGVTTSTIAQPNAIAPGNYTLTVTNTANGCKATDVVVVTQNITPPIANAGPDKILTCSNPTLTIGTAAVAGNSYLWSGSGLSSSVIAQPSTNMSGTYALQVTNITNGCRSTDTVVVTQNITPPLADAGPDITLTCTHPSLAIGTAAISGNTYSWSNASGLSSGIIAQPTANKAGNYTVTVTNTANGCTATDLVNISIDTIRPLANAGVNKTLTCATPTATIGTAAIAGNTYSWLPANGLNNPSIAQPTASSPSNYTVTVTSLSNGCTSTDQVIVSQNIIASAAIAGNDLTLTCSNPSYVIGAPAAPGNSYSWVPAFGLDNANLAQPTVSKPGTYTLTVTNLNNGCTSNDVVTIAIDTTKPVANAGIDKTINCAVSSFAIGTSATVGTTYSWSPASGLNFSNIPQPIVNTSGTYVVTATKTANGCTATDAMTVFVDSVRPIADAGPDQTFGCPHLPLTLGTPAQAGISYNWIRSIGLSEKNIAQPLTDTTGTFVLVVTNTVNRCVSAPDTVVISPKNCDCVFYVPNAFSPNNDGINDILSPFKDCDDYRDFSFSVFNRWGELVFTSKDINTGWNGDYKSENQQVDSYIWILEYFDVLYNTKRLQKGIVTLLR
ncbi:MAG: gliding motility-associated C-terminal domain-containing protein [Chitinophagales bacterium]